MTTTYAQVTGRLLQDMKWLPVTISINKNGLVSQIISNQEGLKGPLLVPGYIDIHCHGGLGADLVSANEEDMYNIGRYLLSAGVTAFVASLHPAPFTILEKAISRLRQVFCSNKKLPKLVGVHFEGPFVSPDKPGALPPEDLHPPDSKLAERLLALSADLACIMTIAPELPGALKLIENLESRGCIPAFGHSTANAATSHKGIKAGIRHSTHLFNAMEGMHHRAPGPIPALLCHDKVTIELICDGIHVHPDMVRLVRKTVGSKRLVLISDATAGAGMPDGPLPWAGRTLTIKNGVARLPDGTLAGSTLSLDRAVRNCIDWGFSKEDAIHSASIVPAKVLGLPSAGIVPGSPFDCTVLSEKLYPLATWVTGQIRWEKS